MHGSTGSYSSFMSPSLLRRSDTHSYTPGAIELASSIRTCSVVSDALVVHEKPWSRCGERKLRRTLRWLRERMLIMIAHRDRRSKASYHPSFLYPAGESAKDQLLLYGGQTDSVVSCSSFFLHGEVAGTRMMSRFTTLMQRDRFRDRTTEK